MAMMRCQEGDISSGVESEGPAKGVNEPIGGNDRSAADWEILVGGNWLNKLGVLLLMVGLALFIGYSFTCLAAVGRIAIGLAASGALLLVGVLAERRRGYEVFGRGFIGGGWAGLYLTTYAAHGFVDPPLIEDPTLAVTLLLAVAVGMIAHSLRYRSVHDPVLTYYVQVLAFP